LADLGEALHSLLLSNLTTYSGNPVWQKNLACIMMVAIRNLHVDCGRRTVKHKYANVFKKVVKFTNDL
jgi:hypothetical protein